MFSGGMGAEQFEQRLTLMQIYNSYPDLQGLYKSKVLGYDCKSKWVIRLAPRGGEEGVLPCPNF